MSSSDPRVVALVLPRMFDGGTMATPFQLSYRISMRVRLRYRDQQLQYF